MGAFIKISGIDAEKIAGKKLDKRTSYYVMKDKDKSEFDVGVLLWAVSKWTDTCSGCSEYDMGNPIYEGAGCHECGYTGKRRQEMFTPYLFKQNQQ